MDKKNLKKSPTGVWLYRRRVPKALQQYYPSETICLSLETKSLTQARIKRDALNSEINLKADETKSSRPSKARFNALFSELRSEYLKGARIERETGEENMFSYAYDPDKKAVRGDRTFEDAYYAAMNGKVPDQFKLTVSELFDEWLTANGTKKNEEYISGVKTAKKALITYLEADEFPETISPGIAQQFIDLLLEEGRASGTVAHYKSKIAEVWRWGLGREKFVGSNVWKETKIEASLDKKDPEHFRNLTQQEAKVLLERTTFGAFTKTWPYPFVTYCLARLLPFLGCRRGELAGAKKSQVNEVDGRLFFEIYKGKTKNAFRIVPVSPIIEPLFKEAVARANNSEYLFPEIGEVKHISKKEAMNSVSSFFSSITGEFEVVEGFNAALHSLRGHFATALEEVGCPEDLAATLAGHKRLSLTYGLYSKYVDKERLWQYVEKIEGAECLAAWVKDLNQRRTTA